MSAPIGLENSRTARPRRASLAVEAALFLPLLFYLMFGMIEYGWMFLRSSEIHNATRQGARVGATEGGTSPAVLSTIQTLMTGANLAGSNYTVDIVPPDVSSQALSQGAPFSVTVTVPYKNGIELFGFTLVPVPADLHAEVTMIKEGPL